VVVGARNGCCDRIGDGYSCGWCVAGVFWLLKSWRTDVKRCVLQWLAVFVVAYVVMLVFWQGAQTDPFHHPLKALTAFTNFAAVHLSFFEGHFVRSTEIPWYYAFKWLLLTLPEFSASSSTRIGSTGFVSNG
jgi:hypothetical protein